MRLLCAAFRYPFSCSIDPVRDILVCAVQAELSEASQIDGGLQEKYLGSMLWFSPSWIDQILNLPTALPL